VQSSCSSSSPARNRGHYRRQRVQLSVALDQCARHHEATVTTLDGDTPSDAYPDITNGSQVAAVNSSGTGIATGTLSYKSATDSPYRGMANYFTFVVSVPGGMPRHGIQVGHNRGTVWESSQQMRQGPLTSPRGWLLMLATLRRAHRAHARASSRTREMPGRSRAPVRSSVFVMPCRERAVNWQAARTRRRPWVGARAA